MAVPMVEEMTVLEKMVVVSSAGEGTGVVARVGAARAVEANSAVVAVQGGARERVEAVVGEAEVGKG